MTDETLRLQVCSTCTTASALIAKNKNQARMIEGYRKDNLETKCEQIRIYCEDHSGMSARMLARDILAVLDGE